MDLKTILAGAFLRLPIMGNVYRKLRNNTGEIIYCGTVIFQSNIKYKTKWWQRIINKIFKLNMGVNAIVKTNSNKTEIL